jgi:putative transcriptional regulator
MRPLMRKRDYLVNHFLVAMPSLHDDTFGKSVIYIYEHTDQGAMGIVVNKPMPLKLGNILQHLGIKSGQADIGTHPVLMGGPVGQEHGFILYKDPQSETPGSSPIELSASKDMLKRIACGQGPANFLVTLGYASWSAGQLEAEIGRNDWLITPADQEILFNTHISQRWRLAGRKVGIHIEQISALVGHA